LSPCTPPLLRSDFQKIGVELLSICIVAAAVEMGSAKNLSEKRRPLGSEELCGVKSYGE
jgi:hypothetical protein